MRGHCYDALVGIAGCDKSLPGMMMAMLRLNVPSVFLYGGSIMPGRVKGKDVTVVDIFEGVGQFAAGKMPACDLDELERHACPGAGACGGQFTANTMACVAEAIGLALPYSSGPPAEVLARDDFALKAGQAVMSLVEKRLRPRDICTRAAFENAAAVVAATGGSTNAALHLPAIANEAGIKFDLFDVAAIFKRTPYLASLKPGGQFVAKDMWEAGGVPMLMRALLDGGYIDGTCLTVTGRTVAENLKDVTFNPNQKVMKDVAHALAPTGGVVGLKGNLAPEGAIVKIAGLKHLKHRGPARVFDCEEDCFAAVQRRDYKEGDVLIIRYEGPRGGPGMREMLSTTAALYGQGVENIALITDGRFSGGTRGLVRRPCRAGSRRWRADRPLERRGYDRHRCGERRDHCRSVRWGAFRTQKDLEAQAGCVRLRRVLPLCQKCRSGARTGRSRHRERPTRCDVTPIFEREGFTLSPNTHQILIMSL